MIHRDQQDYIKQQITTLKVFNDNVQEVIENEVYSIGFTSGTNQLKIYVYLDTKQRNEKPKLIINPLVDHPWVNATTGEIFGAPGLLNYSIHSDVGGVVRAIIREFEKSPISVIANSQNQQQSPNSGISSNQSPAPIQRVNSPYLNDSKLPDFSDFSLDELKKLNEDSQYLNDLAEESESIKDLEDDLDGLIGDVKNLAEENSSKKKRLDELQTLLLDRYSVFKKVGDKYELTNRRYQQKAEEFAPSHIKELLKIAVSTADSECECHVDKFLHGQIEIQTFLDRYMKAKKLSTLRKAKEERLSHQLKALEKATF